MEMRKNKDYIARDYEGVIIGWTTDTVKKNIVSNIERLLNVEYGFKPGKEYELKFGQQEKYLKIYDIKL